MDKILEKLAGVLTAEDLQEIKEVAIFCGLMLECIDPESKIQNSDKQIKHEIYFGSFVF